MILLAAVLAAMAALLAGGPRPRVRSPASVASAPVGSAPARLPVRPVLCLLCGAGAAVFLGGVLGVVAAPAAALAAWVALARSVPGAIRRERLAAQRELPHVVDLFACALRSGASPIGALAAVASACPGPTATRVEGVLARLRMGVDPAVVWGGLADDDILAPLGRVLERAESRGTSVADAVEALADDLESASLAAVEDRARAVGVKAAVPLGLCLLPSFLVLGIVPVVAGLLSSLAP
ncbi:type II secretion system F family protein [Nocardioides piscis]|nr:type II secretion system F family protein [Nocardioides piscis]